MDKLTAAERSKLMASIKGANTTPERIVRSEIHKFGFRFRIHSKDLPGKPDIVMTRYRTVIFVHGCFWHAHRCRHGKKLPKSRTEYWEDKRRQNRLRDRRVVARLKRDGWRVITIWECHTKKLPNFRQRLFTLLEELAQQTSKNA